MASKKTADTPVTAIPTGDGEVAVGGRIGVGTMYRDRMRSSAPLPDEARRDSGTGARSPQPVPVPDDPGLPGLHVSRQVIGREIQFLKAKVEGCERELGRGFLGAAGTVVLHLVEALLAVQAELERLRAEIARLENLTDLEARQFAASKGYS